MKRFIPQLLVIITGLSPNLASGQDSTTQQEMEGVSQTRTAAPGNQGPLSRHFPKIGHVGPSFGVMTYDEPGLMKHEGTLYGIKGGARVVSQQSPTYIFFDGEFLTGENRYDGAYWDGRPLQADIVVTSLSLRGGMGLALINQPSFMLALTGGLGARNYTTDGDPNRGFYYRSTAYLFAPVGTEISSQLTPSTRIYLRGEYDLFLTGRNETRLSDVNSDYGTQEHTQNEGKGYRVSSGVAFAFSEKIDGFAELYYQSWDIEDSTSDYLGVDSSGNTLSTLEPKNTTEFVGFTAGLAF